MANLVTIFVENVWPTTHNWEEKISHLSSEQRIFLNEYQQFTLLPLIYRFCIKARETFLHHSRK
ncbi:MAG: hypothetical protein CL608_22295 [Anaerolineaceae bacterium]|nr:hypothetical protein [Anaerolineaceae bacterium]